MRVTGSESMADPGSGISERAICRLELLFLCLSLCLAAWLRFQHLDKAEFIWDQAEISRWALDMGRGRHITWIGPWSSTRLDTFPLAIWLMAIPYAISPSPIFATGFVAALNLGVVPGCYFLARRWFGRVAATFATLLLAVAPWAVVYSRKIWHTELLPPFILLYVATGWLAFVRRKRWALLAHCLALAALVQIHLTGLAFIPLTALWALFFMRRIDWRLVPLGMLLAIVTFVPYFLVDASRDWRNVRLFFEILRRPATTSFHALRYTWIISTGLELHWLTGPDRYPDFVANTPNLRPLFALEGGLICLGVLLALLRAVRQVRRGLDDETAAALMTTTWLLMPAAFLTRNTTGVAPHYFTTTLPAQFILAGWSLSLFWKQSGRLAVIGRQAAIGLVAILTLAQAHESNALIRFVITHHTPRGYATPMTYTFRALQTATRLVQEAGSGEIILLSEGDDPRMYEMPAVADVLMYESSVPHRSVDIRSALVFPAVPGVYWATFDETPGEALLASLTPELSQMRIPLRENARSFRFYRWPGGQPRLADLRQPPGAPYTWANGARLVGYTLAGRLQPGGSIRWTLVWQVVNVPGGDVQYHWFNHLLDKEGRMCTQSDGPSMVSFYWRVGDTVLNWFELNIPPDAQPPYTMRVGMYSYPELQNVPLSGKDMPMEWVEIGPLDE